MSQSWYRTAEWRQRREAQLRAEPLCRMCRELGYTRAATVADHIVPHRGNEQLFFYGELMSLCKLHHDSTKQRMEKSGRAPGCKADGTPLDAGHHWNK